MNKNIKYCFSIILLFFTTFLAAQSQDFLVYKLKNVGYITLPNTMEVQGGNFKKVAESLQKQLADYYDYELPEDRIVFQRKGVNNGTANYKDSYAKIIFQTVKGQAGDFDKLKSKILLSQQELKDLDIYFKTITQEDMEISNGKILKWYPIEIKSINGYATLKIAYQRSIGTNPPVETIIYRFFNNDRMHSLTFSYRKSDEATWKPIFDNILKSFKITNIR